MPLDWPHTRRLAPQILHLRLPQDQLLWLQDRSPRLKQRHKARQVIRLWSKLFWLRRLQVAKDLLHAWAKTRHSSLRNVTGPHELLLLGS